MVVFTKELQNMYGICKAIGVATLITIVCFSCADDNKTNAPEKKNERPALFSKMLGRWTNIDNNSIEHWMQVGDSSFSSVVFAINNTDTTRTEEALVYPEQGKWVFENKVSGQNNGQAVRFISTVMSDTAIQFSNPAHDFPTDIHYAITGPATMQAYIAGPGKNGRNDTVYFNYRRIKE